MYAAGDYAEAGIQIVGAEEMDVDYPKSPGHEKEWFIAMRDSKKPAMSNFPDYAGPLTETILLGNLAVYKRGRVEWDPVNLKPLNDPIADAHRAADVPRRVRGLDVADVSGTPRARRWAWSPAGPRPRRLGATASR